MSAHEDAGLEDAGLEDAGLEDATAPSPAYDLRLYVAGQSPRSVLALENLRKVCDEHLPGRYRVEIIDLLQNPSLARGDEIVALPTLVRKLPKPIRKIIGDLSDTDQVLVGLQVLPTRPSLDESTT